MNFEEWYKTDWEAFGEKETSKIAWDACKNEILKVLEREKFNIVMKIDYQLNPKVIEEIKKL